MSPRQAYPGYAICPDCDGDRVVEIGCCGANDPSVRTIECPTCEGDGEVRAPEFEDEEEDA